MISWFPAADGRSLWVVRADADDDQTCPRIDGALLRLPLDMPMVWSGRRLLLLDPSTGTLTA